MKRRDMLKTLAGAAGLLAIHPTLSAEDKPTPAPKPPGEEPWDFPLGKPSSYEWRKPDRPVTAAIMGAGERGNVYAGYAHKFPDELKIVGVAEPILHRNENMAKAHGIPDDKRWVTWEDAFKGPKFCDAIIITTPDQLHYGPAMAALEKGYDLMLEKPIAPRWEQCYGILRLARKKERIVAICHVLRYAPYFRLMRDIIHSGYIGDVVSVQHLEPVGHIHMSHSFVRGNWRNTKQSTPMLLSKSCHDLDILRWLIDKPCKKVGSFGSLKFFRKEYAPAGAPRRCTDGCPAEAQCPFSALSIYLRQKSWLHHKDTPGHDDVSILEWLKRTSYGKCVFHNDNDVVDHQVVNMEFEDDITVVFSMEGLTSFSGRRTRVMGTKGNLVGDESNLELTQFLGSKRHVLEPSQFSDFKVQSGHGGGDFGLVRDWIQAILRQDASLLSSTLEASMESHLIAFRAEESRLAGGEVKAVKLKI